MVVAETNKSFGTNIVPDWRSDPHVLIGLSDRTYWNTRSPRTHFAFIMIGCGSAADPGDARSIVDRAEGRGRRRAR
jgi:hypothetical protein